MATQQVKNSTTGTMGVAAAKRSRYEKSEIAYGKIPAAAYASGDTLYFSEIPSKEIIYGKITASNGSSIEFFNQTDYSSALAWSYSNSATVADLQYVITYVRGTGKAHTGLANSAPEVASEQGVALKVTVTVS